jgi:phosphoribosyl 1,2-cyclic phosphate phosphodiesterase
MVRVTILGSGGAAGVPALAAGWGRCDPNEPRNRRTRPSILIDNGTTRVLVDPSPDMREPLRRAGVNRLDAVLYTHAHADHVHGIDDLREINRVMGQGVPIYADPETLETLKHRFAYVFIGPPEGTIIFRPWVEPHLIAPIFSIGSFDVTSWVQDHGYSTSWGFRFGDVAYTTDVRVLSGEAFAALEGVKLWIIGTLTGHTNHPTHADVDLALEWIERVKPEQAVLSHLGTGLDYQTLAARLPVGVLAAYDGMVLEI